MSAKMKCYKCDWSGACKFCPKCGGKMMPDTSADHESPTIICEGKQKDGTYCLSELTTGHHFCSKCGKEAPLTRTGMDKGVMYTFLM